MTIIVIEQITSRNMPEFCVKIDKFKLQLYKCGDLLEGLQQPCKQRDNK